MELPSDCCLITQDGQLFSVNRSVLCKSSKYFTSLFYFPRHSEEIYIPGISGNTMNHLLDYIRSGRVLINDSNICEILTGADYLLLDNLVIECLNFVVDNISIQNCVDLLNVTCELSHLGMKPFCYDFLKANFRDVIDKTEEFLKISSDTWSQLLTDNMQDVKVLWEAIKKWVVADENRLSDLPSLLTSVLSISKSHDRKLIPFVLHSAIVRDNSNCDDIVDNIDQITPASKRSEIHRVCVVGISQQRSNLNAFMIRERYEVYRGFPRTEDMKLTISDSVYMARNILYVFNSGPTFCKTLAVYSTNDSTEETPVNFSGTVTAPVGSQFFCFGGERREDNTVSAYDTEGEIWFDKPPMPFRLNKLKQHYAVTHNDKIYIFDSEIPSIEPNFCPGTMRGFVYDPKQETWNNISAPNIYRRNMKLISYSNFIYAIGGHSISDSRNVTTVEKYDPFSDQWTQFADLTHTFTDPNAFVFGSVLIVFDYAYVWTYSDYLKMNDPVYIHPVSRDWVVITKDYFMEMLRRFLICVVIRQLFNW